jgi:hypothetical protein
MRGKRENFAGQAPNGYERQYQETAIGNDKPKVPLSMFGTPDNPCAA